MYYNNFVITGFEHKNKEEIKISEPKQILNIFLQFQNHHYNDLRGN